MWRDRADFIIHAGLPETDHLEQLWCRKILPNRFELCCIPFFVFDLSLGDIIETTRVGDRQYMFATVIRPSGRYVFRVLLTCQMERRAGIIAWLTEYGALVEWSSLDLIAVDVADLARAEALADYLAEGVRRGDLQYETGRS
ncbi:DUF4265 domain-containing protein [Nakamurella silvestris]|nr:DUF4265 domain-containing protein [Nakamurella silvestris]